MSIRQLLDHLFCTHVMQTNASLASPVLTVLMGWGWEGGFLYLVCLAPPDTRIIHYSVHRQAMCIVRLLVVHDQLLL